MPVVPLVIEPDPDDPESVSIFVDGTIAGRSYRFLLDTGAARTQVEADEFTLALGTAGYEHSSGSFAAQTYPVVTVSDLEVGPMTAASLDVIRADPIPPHPRTLLGMDVL